MFSLKKEERWIKASLVIIISLFFVLNLYSALRYGNQNYLGNFDKFNNDDVKYIRSAWELVKSGHLIYSNVNEPTVFIMPGLPFVIAFFVKIFGSFGGITAFRIFQAILQGLSMYLLFLIGRKTLGSKAALMGCVVDLFYVPEYFTVTVVLTEILFKFSLLLLIYISIYAIEERKILYYTIGGIIWGLSCLVRPTIAAYPAVILIMWLIKKYSLKDMIKFTLVTFIAFSLIMAPWWIRNYKTFNRFIPLTLSTGNPFLQGTYINYNQKIDYTPYKTGQTEIETNRNEMNAGLYRLKTYGRKEPLKYIKWYTLGKMWRLWNSPFYWKEVLGVSPVIAFLYHALVLITALVTSVISIIKRKREITFLLLTILFFNLMYLPYFTMSRYAYPVMPVAGIIAGFGIYKLLIGGGIKLEKTENFNS